MEDGEDLGKMRIQFAVEIIKHSIKSDLIDVEAVINSLETGSKVGIMKHLKAALQQWDYVSHEDYVKIFKEKEYQFIGGNGSCICSHHIKDEYYIYHPITKIVAITGSACISKLGNAKQVRGANEDKKLMLKKEREAKKAKKEAERQKQQDEEVALRLETDRLEKEQRRKEFDAYQTTLFSKECTNCNDIFRSEKTIERWKNMCPCCYLNKRRNPDDSWTWIKCDEYECGKPVKSMFSKCFVCKNKT